MEVPELDKNLFRFQVYLYAFFDTIHGKTSQLGFHIFLKHEYDDFLTLY